MEREIFEVKRERFDLTDRRRYLLQGDWPKEYEARAYLDGVRVETEMEPWENKSAIQDMVDHLDGKEVPQDHVIACENVTAENVADYVGFE